MANENKNINELVSDDDVTAELEIPDFHGAFDDDEDVDESDLLTYNVKDRDNLAEPEAPTLSELQSDLRSRKKTIGRLQFDIEQLRSKWMGLEAEIEAREKQTSHLTDKVDALESSLASKQELIKKRDGRIRALKVKVRERQEEHQQLVIKFDALQNELSDAMQALQQPTPEPRVVEQSNNKGLEFRLAHSEQYADGLRRQLQDLLDTDNGLESSNAQLTEELQATQAELDLAQQKSADLVAKLQDEVSHSAELDSRIAEMERRHTDEITSLQSELSEASNLANEGAAQNERFSSELQELRGQEQELRSALETLEEQSATEIETLQSQLGKAQSSADENIELGQQLSAELQQLRDSEQQLRSKLESIEEQHAAELRTLRFELGEAQETAVEKDELNNQLASDLVDTRSFKEDLERMLTEAEQHAQTKIDELQTQVKTLAKSAEDYEDKLSTKTEAISVLLAELAKKSEQLDSIGEIEDVIHDIDDRISERIGDDGPNQDREEHIVLEKPGRSERVTRLLVGTIDDQVLRFPLFKDRLTIGRTADNDIQLDVAYISRRHAVIQTESGAARIIDWGSKNGVFVNSDRVSEHFLEHGDIVTIGNARFRFEEKKSTKLGR